ncbi:GNAT family N-acetyltransferase [Actinopolyspora sp. H202]|uniref:GNAT family N-acetyltransferase n=1 Tax=Actinopolyspora sp. H202 TaxID=1500456 RepID=UPI003EE4C653
MTAGDSVGVRQYRSSASVSTALRRELVGCWVAVTNAGGAAGFPFPPVTAAQVEPAVDALSNELAEEWCRILVAERHGGVVGWLVLRADAPALTAHNGSVHHVQSHPAARGRGVGTALLSRVHEIARDELGLEQLRLAARDGMGLEDFYARLGWKEIGRWPGALRLSPGDDRDEILMALRLA